MPFIRRDVNAGLQLVLRELRDRPQVDQQRKEEEVLDLKRLFFGRPLPKNLRCAYPISEGHIRYPKDIM